MVKGRSFIEGRRFTPALLLLILLLITLNVIAHKLHHPKVIIVEVNKDNIRVMINYISNPGDQSEHLRRKFDLNRDGKLSTEEQDELQKFLIKNCLSNLVININGSIPEFEPLDYKFENLDNQVDTSRELGVDIHLLSKRIEFLKFNELRIRDFLVDSPIHVPLIVKFSADFQIQSTSMGSIVKKSNLIRDIELERGKEVTIRFKRF